jgi:uncharacterized membrane protein
VTGKPRALVALAVLFWVAFAILADFAVTQAVPASLGAVLSLVPLALLVTWAARRSGHALAGALLFAAAAVLLWLNWGQLQRHFPSIFYLEHAGMNLSLAFLFGRTLRAGREPLVSTFARVLQGAPLPPEVMRYTRRVTIAWTVFFLALFTLSSTLYLGGFREAWSFLANIASPLMLCTMFAAEYAIRMRALPHWHRTGLLSGIRAFSRHFAQARADSPR